MADNTIEIEFSATGDRTVIKAIDALDRSTKKLIQAQVKLTGEGKKQKNSNKAHENSVKRLEIKLQALGFSFKQAGISAKMQQQASKGNRLELERMRIATQKFIATQTQADVSTRILGGSLAVLRSKLLIYNFAMALGIRQTIKFAQVSANVESMQTAFKTLSGATENSTVALIKLKKATNNTMSEFNLFQQANNAMVLGVTKNSDEMAEMFDVAQRLGRALGRDTASSVESLITGIGRQSRLMLDNIGIIVKSDEAYEAYAKKLGITADQLSDVDKKQAFLIATMESARAKVKTLGDEVLSTKDNIDSFSTAFENLGVSIGKNIPFFNKMTTSLTRLARLTGQLIEPYDPLIEAQKNHTKAVEAENKARINLESVEKTHGFSKDKLIKKYKKEIENQKILQNMYLEITDSLFTQVKAEEQAQKAKEQNIQGIIKEESTIKRNIDQTNKAFKLKSQLQAGDLAFHTELQKKQDKLYKEDEKNHKKLIEAKSSANKAYYDGLKMAQDNAGKELKEMQDEMQAQNEQLLNSINSSLSAFDGVLSAWKANMQARMDAELSTLKDSEKYKNADSERRKDLEREVTKGYAQEQLKQFRIGQASAIADIGMNTASALMSSVAGSWVTIGQPWFGIIASLGALQAGLVASQKPPSFEKGGLVGGQRHSQGGTMIEAEQGEFVMSRNAVQSIGIETLSQINQGGGAGITLNISAPLVDDTILDTIIPAINKAVQGDRATLISTANVRA